MPFNPLNHIVNRSSSRFAVRTTGTGPCVFIDTPHGECRLGNEEGHWCDTIVNPLAIEIEKLLEGAGFRVVVLNNKLPRWDFDANRQPARNEPYRRKLRSLLGWHRPWLFIDLHSFWKDDPAWKKYDIVLLKPPTHPCPELYTDLTRAFEQEGLVVGNFTKDGVVDIVSTSSGVVPQSFLLEINESWVGREEELAGRICRAIGGCSEYYSSAIHSRQIEAAKTSFTASDFDKLYRKAPIPKAVVMFIDMDDYVQVNLNWPTGLEHIGHKAMDRITAIADETGIKLVTFTNADEYDEPYTYEEQLNFLLKHGFIKNEEDSLFYYDPYRAYSAAVHSRQQDAVSPLLVSSDQLRVGDLIEDIKQYEENSIANEYRFGVIYEVIGSRVHVIWARSPKEAVKFALTYKRTGATEKYALRGGINEKEPVKGYKILQRSVYDGEHYSAAVHPAQREAAAPFVDWTKVKVGDLVQCFTRNDYVERKDHPWDPIYYFIITNKNDKRKIPSFEGWWGATPHECFVNMNRVSDQPGYIFTPTLEFYEDFPKVRILKHYVIYHDNAAYSAAIHKAQRDAAAQLVGWRDLRIGDLVETIGYGATHYKPTAVDIDDDWYGVVTKIGPWGGDPYLPGAVWALWHRNNVKTGTPEKAKADYVAWVKAGSDMVECSVVGSVENAVEDIRYRIIERNVGQVLGYSTAVHIKQREAAAYSPRKPLRPGRYNGDIARLPEWFKEDYGQGMKHNLDDLTIGYNINECIKCNQLFLTQYVEISEDLSENVTQYESGLSCPTCGFPSGYRKAKNVDPAEHKDLPLSRNAQVAYSAAVHSAQREAASMFPEIATYGDLRPGDLVESIDTTSMRTRYGIITSIGQDTMAAQEGKPRGGPGCVYMFTFLYNADLDTILPNNLCTLFFLTPAKYLTQRIGGSPGMFGTDMPRFKIIERGLKPKGLKLTPDGKGFVLKHYKKYSAAVHKRQRAAVSPGQRYWTRADYMAGKCTHVQYYEQFVDDSIIRTLWMDIGYDRIIKSKDDSFNDISLTKWENLPISIETEEGLRERGDFLSTSSIVCIYKAGARLIRAGKYTKMPTEAYSAAVHSAQREAAGAYSDKDETGIGWQNFQKAFAGLELHNDIHFMRASCANCDGPLRALDGTTDDAGWTWFSFRCTKCDRIFENGEFKKTFPFPFPDLRQYLLGEGVPLSEKAKEVLAKKYATPGEMKFFYAGCAHCGADAETRFKPDGTLRWYCRCRNEYTDDDHGVEHEINVEEPLVHTALTPGTEDLEKAVEKYLGDDQKYSSETHCSLCHAKFDYGGRRHRCTMTDTIRDQTKQKNKYEFFYIDKPTGNHGNLIATVNEQEREPWTVTGDTIQKRLGEAVRLVRDQLVRWVDKNYVTKPTDHFIKAWVILNIIPDNFECRHLRPVYEQMTDDQSLFISCEFVSNYLENRDEEKYSSENDVKVTTVGKKTLKDYMGMNREAGKAFGFTPLPAENEVFVARGLSDKDRKATIKHEAVEAKLMKNGSSYWPAHQRALEAEKEDKPVQEYAAAIHERQRTALTQPPQNTIQRPGKYPLDQLPRWFRNANVNNGDEYSLRYEILECEDCHGKILSQYVAVWISGKVAHTAGMNYTCSCGGDTYATLSDVDPDDYPGLPVVPRDEETWKVKTAAYSAAVHARQRDAVSIEEADWRKVRVGDLVNMGDSYGVVLRIGDDGNEHFMDCAIHAIWRDTKVEAIHAFSTATETDKKDTEDGGKADSLNGKTYPPRILPGGYQNYRTPAREPFFRAYSGRRCGARFSAAVHPAQREAAMPGPGPCEPGDLVYMTYKRDIEGLAWYGLVLGEPDNENKQNAIFYAEKYTPMEIVDSLKDSYYKLRTRSAIIGSAFFDSFVFSERDNTTIIKKQLVSKGLLGPDMSWPEVDWNAALRAISRDKNRTYSAAIHDRQKDAATPLPVEKNIARWFSVLSEGDRIELKLRNWRYPKKLTVVNIPAVGGIRGETTFCDIIFADKNNKRYRFTFYKDGSMKPPHNEFDWARVV